MTASKVVGIALACLLACGGDDNGGEPDAAPLETLDPEPAGAPTATVMQGLADLDCLGVERDPPSGSSVELTGYIRTLLDPTAEAAPPTAQVVAYTASGTELGSGFADETKDGRVAISVSFSGDGFNGYVDVTQAGYLPYRFQTNRPISVAEVDAYAWLVTDADVTAWEATLDITQQDGNGILVGSVQDCDAFALENAVVQVAGETGSIYFLNGPTPTSCPTGVACSTPFSATDVGVYTNATGRFALPNVPAGSVTVKAYGRLTSGGPLTLISTINTTVVDGGITAVGLLPNQ